jgi:hypothetical protein
VVELALNVAGSARLTDPTSKIAKIKGKKKCALNRNVQKNSEEDSSRKNRFKDFREKTLHSCGYYKKN